MTWTSLSVIWIFIYIIISNDLISWYGSFMIRLLLAPLAPQGIVFCLELVKHMKLFQKVLNFLEMCLRLVSQHLLRWLSHGEVFICCLLELPITIMQLYLRSCSFMGFSCGAYSILAALISFSANWKYFNCGICLKL